MEGRRKQIEAFISRLERHGAKIMGLDLGGPIPNDRLALIAELDGTSPPPALLDLYCEIDGAALMWNATDQTGALAGGFNLQESRVALLRNGAEPGGEPLEGILWTGDEAPDHLALFKKMVIFDSVPGRNDYMTFLIDDPAKVYLITDGDPQYVHCSFEEVLNTLIEYGGADSLREHLTAPDWRDRVAADAALSRINAL